MWMASKQGFDSNHYLPRIVCLDKKKAGLLTNESEQKRLPKNVLSNSFQWPLLLFFSITVTRIVPEFHEIPFFQQGYLSYDPCSKTLTGECYNFEYQLARIKFIDEL